MRSVDIHLTTARGWFGPFHRGVVESAAVRLRAVHEIRLLNDGTTVMLYEYAGDEAAARRLAAEYFDSEQANWQTATIDGTQLMYANARPSTLVAGILSVLDEWRIAVDWPITFSTDERLKATLVGDHEAIREALRSVPDDVNVQVNRTGEYRSERDAILTDLTPREREILETAVALGYYRNPRGANYTDLAAALDCSTGTVGEHLRNAETKVMAALFDSHDTDRSRLAEAD
ncbi:helix-turn-helix domain-containing protein [Natronomonas halophila]|uniref:helix-turn-helix domain-containing protein n=1 Tax=Natronomonas halophila TaxID=2747817 RepID=UPI003CCD7435